MANQRYDFTIGFNADTSKLSTALKQLESQLNNLALGRNLPNNLLTSQIQQASKAAVELNSYLNKAINVDTGALDLSKFTKELTLGKTDLKTIRENLVAVGPAGQEAFASLTRAIGQAEMPLRRTNEMVDKLWITLKNTVRWQVTSGFLTGITSIFSDAVRYAEDLNESLNNIRIVTGKSSDEMAQFAKQANRAAKELNTTTTRYAEGSLVYFQQGLDDASVKARTDVTAKFANVSRETLATSSEYLTAIWNNFAKGSKNLEYFADVVVALGAATASSSQEIATGLNKFAATAETVGLSYEYATAALATVTATTRQSADVVGTALKTLFSRIQDLELGKTLDDGTTLGKYSQALDAVGISIKDSNGNLKEMDAILDEMGDKWQNLGKAEQIALAQTVGGVRQYTQLIALLDNWDFMKENLATAYGSTGALQEQADIFAESWEAARKKVKASAEGIYDSLINDNFWIDLTNGFADVLDFIEKIADAAGGLKGVLAAVALVANKFLGERVKGGLRDIAYEFSRITGKEGDKTIALKQSALDTLSGSNETDVNLRSQNRLTKDIVKFQLDVNEATKNMTESQKKALELQIELVKKTQELALAQNQVAVNAQRANEATIAQAEGHVQERDVHEVQLSNLREAAIQAEVQRMEQESTEEWDDARRAAQLESSRQGVLSNIQKRYDQYGFDQLASMMSAAASRQAALGRIRTYLIDNKVNDKQILQEVADRFGLEIVQTAEQTDEEFKTLLLDKLRQESIESSNTRADLEAYIRGTFEYSGRDPNGERFNNIINNIRGDAVAAGDAIYRGSIAWMSQHRAMSTPLLPDNTSSIKWEDVLQDTFVGIQQVTIATQGLKSALGGLFDETLEPAERFESFVYGLSLSIPSILGTIKTINTSAELAKLAKSLPNFKILQGKPTLLQFGPYLAAIAAVVAFIKYLSAAIVTNEEKTQQLKEQQELLKSRLDETKSAASDLKDSFEKLRDANVTVDGLITGTQEWKDAVKDVNQEVLELIEKYPELAKEVENVNGKLTIGVVAQEKLLKAQEEAQAQAEKGYYSAQIANNNQTYSNAILDYREDLLKQGTNFVATEASIRTVVKAAVQDSDILADPERIKELLGGMADQQVLDFFTEHANDMLTLADRLEENTESLRLLASQFVESSFGEDLSNLEDGLSTLYAETSTKYTSQVKTDEIDRLSRSELVDLYAEKILGAGATGKASSIFGDSGTFYDAKGNEIGEVGYAAMKDALANYQAMDLFAEAITPIIEELQKTYSDEFVNALLKMSSGDFDINELDQEGIDQLKRIFGDKLIEILNSLGVDDAEVIKNYYNPDDWNQIYHDRISADSEYGKLLNERDNNLNLYIKYQDDYSKAETEAAKQDILENYINPLVEEINKNADEIKLKVDSNLSGDVDEAFAIIDDFVSLQEKIANDLEMTSEDVQALITEGYGEMLQNCTITSEGLWQLNQETVDRFVEGKKAEIEADREAKIAQLETQRTMLEVEAKSLEAKQEYLEQGLAAEGETAKATALANAIMEQAKADAAAQSAAAIIEGNNETTVALSENAQALSEFINDQLSTTIVNTETTNANINSSTNALANNVVTYWEQMRQAKAAYFNEDGTGKGVAYSPSGIMSVDTDPALKGSKDALSSVDLANADAVRKKISDLADAIKRDYTSAEIDEVLNQQLNSTKSQYDKVQAQIGAIDAALAKLKSPLIDTIVGGSGGSDSQKELKEVLERYHEITREIEYQKELLDDIGTAADRAYGTDKVEMLTQKIEKLNKVAELQAQKQAAASAFVVSDLEALRAAGLNVRYDTASMELKNYTELLNQITDEYNSRINSVSKDQQDMVQKEYDDKMQLLENYEDSIDTFREQLNAYEDAMREIEDAKLEKVQEALQVRLDWKEMRDTLREFEKEINSSIGDALDQTVDNVLLDEQGVKDQIELFADYETKANALLDMIRNANQYTNVQELQQELANLRQELADNGSAMLEYVDTLKNALPDAIDAASERFEEFISMLENSQNTLSAINDLIDLQTVNYGLSRKYAALGESYNATLENAFTQAKLQKQYAERAETELKEAEIALANAIQGTAEYDILKANRDALLDEYQTAQDAMLEATASAMEAAKSIYSNTLDEIFYEFESKMTKGLGYDQLQAKYDRTKDEDNRFLDGVNRYVETETLNNKVRQSIENATSDYAKSQLKALEEEFAQRQANNDLSEYDLKIMEAKYNMTLKQIALEEAQNAKSKVRLVRGANGNYNYLFTADNADIASKQQDYLKAMQDYYNTAKDQTENITGEIVSLWKEMSEEIRKIYEDDTLNVEQRQNAINEIQDYYQKKYADLAKMQKDAAKDMTDAGNIALDDQQKAADRYGDDTSEAAQNFQKNFQRILEEMGGNADEFNSDYQDQLINLVAIEGSFTETTAEMFSKLNDALTKYKGNIENISNDIGVSYDQLTDKINQSAIAAEELEQKATTAIDEIWNKIDEIQDVTQAQAAWTKEIYNTISAMQKLASETASAVQKYNEAVGSIKDLGATGSWSGGTSSGSSSGGTGGTSSSGSSATKPSTSSSSSSSGRIRKQLGMFDSTSRTYKLLTLNGAVYEGGGWWNYPSSAKLQIESLAADYTRSQTASYATGGYTGEWANGSKDGRLAVLHQKELVLNQEDTKNILSAVQSIRDLTPTMISDMRQRLAGSVSASMNLFGSRFSGMSTAFDRAATELAQSVNINADFPGVRDAIEIKEALESLVQTSAQRINFYTK